VRKSPTKNKHRIVDSSEEDELDDDGDDAEKEDRSKRRRSNEGVARPGHTKPRAIATTTRKVASRPDPSLPSTPPSSGDARGVTHLNPNRARDIAGRGAAGAAARTFLDEDSEEEQEDPPSDDEVEQVRPPLAATAGNKRAPVFTRANETGKTSSKTSKSSSSTASAPPKPSASSTSSRPASRQTRTTAAPSILRKSSRIIDSDDDASVASVRSTRSRTNTRDTATTKKGKTRATPEEDEEEEPIRPVKAIKKQSKPVRARERGFEGTALMERRDSLLMEDDFLPPDQPLINRPAAAAIALEKAAEAVLLSSPAPIPTSVIKVVVKPYDIDAELECAVCYEIMVAPVNLTCGHVFCQACVEPWLDHNDNECPNCREKSGKPFRSYPIDAIIKKHLEVVYTALEEQGQVEAAKTARTERAKVEAAAVQKRIEDARQKELRTAREAAEAARLAALQQANARAQAAQQQGFAYPGVLPQHRVQAVRRPAPVQPPAPHILRDADIQRMAQEMQMPADQLRRILLGGQA